MWVYSLFHVSSFHLGRYRTQGAPHGPALQGHRCWQDRKDRSQQTVYFKLSGTGYLRGGVRLALLEKEKGRSDSQKGGLCCPAPAEPWAGPRRPHRWGEGSSGAEREDGRTPTLGFQAAPSPARSLSKVKEADLGKALDV